MRKGSRGSIVIVSSASGLKASPGASAYCVSKAAQRLFAKSVALECAQNGGQHSGQYGTSCWRRYANVEIDGFLERFVEQNGREAEAWKALASTSPLKRFAQPEEIAQAILYLASDESLFVTGTELVIDGGFTA